MIEDPRIRDLALVVVRSTRQAVEKHEAYEEAFERALHSPQVHEAHLTPAEQFDLKIEAESLYRTETLAQAKTSPHSSGAKAFTGGRIPRRSSNPSIRTSGDDWRSRAAGDKPDAED